ncbi:MAG: glucose-6-phosphate isomerase [Betaproteobacteria bacterium]|nr:glucose-6-phosphate isomerase [Betaproteobacteria bacterium]
MSTLTHSPAWRALEAHRRSLLGVRITELFRADPARAERFSRGFGRMHLDYSRQLATQETMQLLLALARQADVEGWVRRMFAGEAVNDTEGRAALHVALRTDQVAFPAAGDVMPQVRAVRERMRETAVGVRAGTLRGAAGKPFASVVNLGIGGSDLGPRMATRALRACSGAGVRVRYVANADPADLDAALAGLDPATTLFIVTSKTFTTVETLDNARRARAWLERSLGPRAALAPHFLAVTANEERAREFGVDAERIFPMWDWVGGRYSIWSAVALPLVIAIGMDAFDELLEGARDMDAHFHTTPPERNLPVILALLGIWNINFLGAGTHAAIPYCEDLRELPAYLQQLEMESNGKRVDRDGKEVDYDTAPVIWGASGTPSQHSFHQLLHQGTRLAPVDFILAADGEGDQHARDLLLASALAQGEALMSGTASEEPHRRVPGNRPFSILLLERLSPEALGQLLALYEHKVFVQGVIWNINSFDQWGVELGKRIAVDLLPALRDGEVPPQVNSATRDLIERIRRLRRPHA